MNPVMTVLAFMGSVVVYSIIVLVLSAIIDITATHQSVSDDFWPNACFAQYAIALVVLAIYFANKMTGVS